VKNKPFRQENAGNDRSRHGRKLPIHNNGSMAAVSQLPFNAQPEGPESGFEAMVAQAQQFAEMALAGLKDMPLAHEEVKDFIDGIIKDLRRVVETEKYGSSLCSLPFAVNSAWRDLDEISPILRDSYEVQETAVLEDIKIKLTTWLLQCGYTPGHTESNVPKPGWMSHLRST
jgi:hypothetical protein